MPSPVCPTPDPGTSVTPDPSASPDPGATPTRARRRHPTRAGRPTPARPRRPRPTSPSIRFRRPLSRSPRRRSTSATPRPARTSASPGAPVASKCCVACWCGEESQQPTCPQVRHSAQVHPVVVADRPGTPGSPRRRSSARRSPASARCCAAHSSTSGPATTLPGPGRAGPAPAPPPGSGPRRGPPGTPPARRRSSPGAAERTPATASPAPAAQPFPGHVGAALRQLAQPLHDRVGRAVGELVQALPGGPAGLRAARPPRPACPRIGSSAGSFSHRATSRQGRALQHQRHHDHRERQPDEQLPRVRPRPPARVSGSASAAARVTTPRMPAQAMTIGHRHRRGRIAAPDPGDQPGQVGGRDTSRRTGSHDGARAPRR